MKTLYDVRLELSHWGKFWHHQEQGQGYASKSNIQTLRETLQVGCAIQGTSHLINDQADSINVPDYILEIGNKIDRLKPDYVKAIRQRYVIGEGVYLFTNKKIFFKLIDKAEIALL